MLCCFYFCCFFCGSIELWKPHGHFRYFHTRNDKSKLNWREYKNFQLKHSVNLCTAHAHRRAAKNLIWGGHCFWGQKEKPPAAGSHKGFGGKAPSCQRLRFLGQQRSKLFHNLILGLFGWKLMLLKQSIQVMLFKNMINWLRKWVMWKVANGEISILLFTSW